MTTQSKQEESLRQRITDVCYQYASVTYPVVNALEILINSEVLAVLEELEKQQGKCYDCNHDAVDDESVPYVPLSAIQAIKEKYSA